MDLFLEFLAARCRPNTVLAAGFDLKVFFTLFPVEPAEVTTADVLVDTVVGLGADMGWEPTDVVVRLKDNAPFHMTADSPEDSDQGSVTIGIRQYQADELADPDFLEEIGLSHPVERYEDGSSLFIQDAPERGVASANVVIADLVISVQSQDLVWQDRAPVKARVLADAARGMAATAQRDLSAN